MLAEVGRSTTVGGRPSEASEPRVLRLAVVVPTFREAGNVGRLIARLRSVLPAVPSEIIVVDDWSDDGTAEVVEAIAERDPAVRLIRRHGRRGLSGAVVEGMLATVAPVVAVIDADLQHDERILPALYDAVAGGADVAIGTRYAIGGSTGEWSRGRLAASRLATRSAGLFRRPRTPLSDPMSGFFAVRRSVVLEAAPRLSGMGFKILLDIVLSSRTALKVAEVPFVFRCRSAGTSKLDGAAAVDFALLLLDKALGGRISPRLVMFGLVGLFGLLVNLAVLRLVIGCGVGFAWGQALGAATSIVSNFAINNELTYRDRRLRGGRWLLGLATFTVICGFGAAANIGVGGLLYRRHHAWWTAGVVGAIVASLWNYLASGATAWGRR